MTEPLDEKAAGQDERRAAVRHQSRLLAEAERQFLESELARLREENAHLREISFTPEDRALLVQADAYLSLAAYRYWRKDSDESMRVREEVIQTSLKLRKRAGEAP